MNGFIGFLTFIFIAGPIIAIIAWIVSANKRKANTEEMIRESQSVDFNATTTVANYIWFDDDRKKWAIPTKLPYGFEKYAVTKDTNLYKYSQIINYELLEDGNTITKGGVSIGKAIVGGALFGGVGAVIGGTSGKRITKNTCKSLRIKITIDDITSPTVYINLISMETSTDGALYKLCYDSAQKILSTLDIITKADSYSNTPSTSNTNSPADEVKKLKDLLDIGAITQDEFDKKKKELLDL